MRAWLLIWILFFSTAIVLSWKASAEPLDLNARIAGECGKPGFRPDAGCTLRIRKGVYEIKETVQIGECAAHNARPGVNIVGEGQGGTTYPAWSSVGATVLRWDGPAGGTMFNICGAPQFLMSDLTLILDPGKDGKEMAKTGIRLSSDNRKGGTTQNPRILRVGIHGSPVENDSVGIHITGENHNDQTDRVHVEDGGIVRVGTAVLQDSQQSVFTRLVHLNTNTYRAGVHVNNGSATIGPGIAFSQAKSSDESKWVGILIDRHRDEHQWMTAHNLQILRNHWEWRAGHAIRDMTEDYGMFVLSIVDNNFVLQCPQKPCKLPLVYSRRKGPTRFDANTIGATGHSGQTAVIWHSGGPWFERANYVRPNVGGGLERNIQGTTTP